MPALGAFLSRGEPRVTATNWKLVMPVYQAWGEGLAAPVDPLRYRAEVSGRIVLGAFTQQIMDEDAELRKLLLPETRSVPRRSRCAHR